MTSPVVIRPTAASLWLLTSALASGIAWAQEPVTAPALSEVIVTAEKRAENIQDVPISVQALSAQQLKDAGILIDAAGLKPSAKGARVEFSGGSRSVAKGPFPNVRDLVAGYWLWEVHDLDEAIEWVKRCPNPMPGPSVIEIRPLYEPEDFAKR